MAQLLSKLSFGECRDTGHVWRRFGGLVTDRQGGVTRQHRCENCGTKRQERINLWSGEVETRRYDHAEGYLIDYKEQYPEEYKRKRYFSKADFRKELLVGQLKRAHKPIPRAAARGNGNGRRKRKAG